ncbi:MAG: hypothetical protein ACE5JG_07185, partial [Planctomycetota bacterium]
MNKGVVLGGVVLLAGALAALLFLLKEKEGPGRRGAAHPAVPATEPVEAAGRDEPGAAGFRIALRTPGGSPAAGARLLVQDGVGGRYARSAGADGVFEWRDAGLGRFTLWATHAGAVGERAFAVTEPGLEDLG